MVSNKELGLGEYKAIFDGATDGILGADIKTKKFMIANPEICKMIGYPSKKLLKLTVNDIHPKKDLPYVLEQFKKLGEKKITLAKNIPVLRKDKKIIYCDINSKIIKIGKKKFLVGFFRDITEQKKSEEELKKSQEKLNKINQELQSKVEELERFYKLSVGRELKMAELKNKIKELENKLKIREKEVKT